MNRETVKQNIRAGEVADRLVDILDSEGFRDALVWVADPEIPTRPRAVRTVGKKGFGNPLPKARREMVARQIEAIHQVNFASAANRSSDEQVRYMSQKQRSAASYGRKLPYDLTPNWAIDPISGLVVVAVTNEPQANGSLTSEYAEIAVDSSVNIEKKFTLPEAAQFIWMCALALDRALPIERAGVVMMTHTLLGDMGAESDLAICASQMVGSTSRTTNFEIVAAKARAVVALSGNKPSGSLPFPNRGISNIPGAIKVEFGEKHQRIVAVGGLTDGNADVAIIREAAKNAPKDRKIVALG